MLSKYSNEPPCIPFDWSDTHDETSLPCAGNILHLTAHQSHSLLAPLASSIGERWLRVLAIPYLALMLCYGAANIANDVWLEQVVKRGWTGREIPDMLQPSVSIGWAAIIVAAAALAAAAEIGARGAARPHRLVRKETKGHP